MSNELTKWIRLTRLLMWVTGVATVVIVLLIFTPLFVQAEHLRRQNSELQKQIDQIRGENEKLAARIAALQQDPHAVEKEARETLGLAKPYETVYRFHNPANTPTAPKNQ